MGKKSPRRFWQGLVGAGARLHLAGGVVSVAVLPVERYAVHRSAHDVLGCHTDRVVEGHGWGGRLEHILDDKGLLKNVGVPLLLEGRGGGKQQHGKVELALVEVGEQSADEGRERGGDGELDGHGDLLGVSGWAISPLTFGSIPPPDHLKHHNLISIESAHIIVLSRWIDVLHHIMVYSHKIPNRGGQHATHDLRTGQTDSARPRAT